MSDLKLFRTSPASVAELSGGAVPLEKSLQTLFEANLEALLGVRFLASEYVTNEGGRIDTLGIDENDTPVVIEYKRSSNENVINQGLSYLDWLMGHRKDFDWLVFEKLGAAAAKQVNWSGSRLICIAGDYNKWDEQAVKQMGRNIALFRYRRYAGDLLLLEQLTATSAKPSNSSQSGNYTDPSATPAGKKYKTTTDDIAEAPPGLRDIYHALKAHLEALGDNVEIKMNDKYVAFRRIKNFACVLFRNKIGKLLVYVCVNPDSVTIEPGFTNDMRATGHYGTGDLEITIKSMGDLEKAKPLLDAAYQNA
jgi:predicted transport protein